MVESLNLFQDGGGLFGGFRGLFDQPFGGNGNKRPLSGLLGNNSGLQSNALALSSNPLLQRIEQQDKDKDEEEKDKVELSEFVQDAAEEAVANARRTPGATSQVFVSEDGRFEVSVDLQVRSDGSFDLGLAVGFAQSSGAAIESSTTSAIGAEDETSEDGETGVEPSAVENPLGALSPEFSSSFSGSVERFTSFEQSLSTRDLQVDIFFEEAESVAFEAEQRFGAGAADQFNAVAGQISNEFRLNINISGSDINNFNQAASDLLQFDNTGTLGGFLSAASNVLNNNSSDIGSFIDATRGLVGSARVHVSAKLNNFFTGINEQFGGSLEEIGFQPNFLQSIGEDVQNDLDTFFSVTNDLLGGLSNNRETIEDEQDIENLEFNILEESLRELRENQQQNESVGFDLFTNPENLEIPSRLIDQNQDSIRDILEKIAAENEQQSEQSIDQPIDGELAVA